MRSNRGEKGFTLIEVLIVIVVIAILAAIVVPRLMGAARRARETALRGQLVNMRKAIRFFEGEFAGHPCQLTHLMSDTPPNHCHADGTGARIDIDQGAVTWNGPYLTTPDGQLPVDPMTGLANWSYSWRTGKVHSRATGTALDGTAYSNF